MATINPEKIRSRHPLGTGVTLQVWDRSRPIAGDRWLVVLEGATNVPVNAATPPPEPRHQAAAVTAVLGCESVYSRKGERNFIAGGRPRPPERN